MITLGTFVIMQFENNFKLMIWTVIDDVSKDLQVQERFLCVQTLASLFHQFYLINSDGLTH